MMRLRWTLTLAVALSLISACGPITTPQAPQPTGLPATGQPASPTETVPTATPDRPLAALVNNQPIYLVDYERQVAQYQAAMVASGVDLTGPEGQQRLLRAREQILNWMIEQVLMEQAAAQMGIVVTDEEVQAALDQIVQQAGGEEAFQARLEQEGLTLQDVWRELQAEMIGAAVIERVIASVPTTAEHVQASHILVDTREEAERILAQLRAGADFAEMARAYSQDTSTSAAGGDLGFFPRGVLLAPEVEEAAFQLQPGQISSVVQSSFGFHIIQVVRWEPNHPLSPENLQFLRDKAVQEWTEALWSNAVIERFVNTGS